ncbi:MAG: GNAT family N-acetyltransferase [Bacteroidales bacterium]|nr:GNAT family N-acetyltransferase [Bacteroidales bacterium]
MIGKHVFLRAVELSDVDVLFQLENDPSIWSLSETIMPFSRFAIEQYVMNSSTQDVFTAKQLRLIVCENTDKNIVGTVDIYDFNPMHQRAGVGILILEPYRRKGYASEALQLLMHYAFSVLQLHQLYANISADNVASIALFTQIGFEQTGRRKAWHKKNMNRIDELFFQYIRKE